jgi:hypothetical protein
VVTVEAPDTVAGAGVGTAAVVADATAVAAGAVTLE